MQDQYDLFLKYIPSASMILDVGFGSGRDMLYFSSLGYNVFGIDIVPDFILNAKSQGLNVYNMDVNNICLDMSFDGIWACASLLHLDDIFLPIAHLTKVLKPNGVIYLSMKYGVGQDNIDGITYKYMDEHLLSELANNCGLTIKEFNISGDKLFRGYSWINCILAK